MPVVIADTVNIVSIIAKITLIALLIVCFLFLVKPFLDRLKRIINIGIDFVIEFVNNIPILLTIILLAFVIAHLFDELIRYKTIAKLFLISLLG